MRRLDVIRHGLPVAAAVATLLAPIGASHEAHLAVAVSVWMVAAWLLEPMHPALVGVVGCFLYWASGAAAIEIAFGGFGHAMPWAVYGALILLAAARYGNVDRHFARLLPPSSQPAWLTIVALAVAASFVVPSAIGRAFIVALVVLGAARTKSAPGDGRTPASLLLLIGAYAATSVDRNLIGRSALAAWAFVDLIASGAVAIMLRSAPAAAPEPAKEQGPTASLEFRAAVLVAATLVAWMTTPVHRLSSGLVALAAGMIACLPLIGPIAPHKAQSPDPLAILLVGTAMSMPMVLAKTGAAALITSGAIALGQALATVLPTAPATYWAGVAYHLFAPGWVRPDTVTAVAQVTGLPTATVADIWQFSAATPLAVYQAPALIIAASLVPLRGRDVLLLGLSTLAVGSVAVLFL